MVPAAAAMRLVAAIIAGLAVTLVACGLDISQINSRPASYYQKTVDFRGQLTRRQDLPDQVLLEIADTRGARILVQAPGDVEVLTGDWVEVRGILVPEARVGDAILYDVVNAERVRRTRPPRFANLM
jgi:hypothetical protein